MMLMLQSAFQNPLEECKKIHKSPDPCVMVIFGATGDLTARKLLPALYNLAREGQLPAHFACVAFARRPKEHEEFRKEMREAVELFSRVKPVREDLWRTFSEQIFYHVASFEDHEGYARLREYLNQVDKRLGTKGNRVYYLSTQPSYFPTIVEKLSQNGLIYNPLHITDKWSRVIIEKPFGHDFSTSCELQRHISKFLDEDQVFRIDHYLGKETVQNLLTFRFANSIFESIWNNKHVDHVQITVSEEIGIGTRGRFWEEAGMLRDIVQNHMMQLLSLVAMEPPSSMNADAIRDEKVKVLESIRPIKTYDMDRYCVRGQYGPGYVNGKAVQGYRQENNVDPESKVETYVALQLFIDNWRWGGVPFYLRGGKRLPKRCTEIAIHFKMAPGHLFSLASPKQHGNVLVIRIQPDEGISLKTNCKVPGLNNPIQPVKMDFRYGAYFGSTPPEAYERLICDCMAGDGTLFARSDEVLTSWHLMTPILDYWKEHPATHFPNYEAGSWGPKEADLMLGREGRSWRLI